MQKSAPTRGSKTEEMLSRSSLLINPIYAALIREKGAPCQRTRPHWVGIMTDLRDWGKVFG